MSTTLDLALLNRVIGHTNSIRSEIEIVDGVLSEIKNSSSDLSRLDTLTSQVNHIKSELSIIKEELSKIESICKNAEIGKSEALDNFWESEEGPEELIPILEDREPLTESPYKMKKEDLLKRNSIITNRKSVDSKDKEPIPTLEELKKIMEEKSIKDSELVLSILSLMKSNKENAQKEENSTQFETNPNKE